LEQINTQYYVATLGDEYETFANWRRSGYPVLKPVNYFGNVTNGTIPRRFTYPTDEANSNTANYQAAIKEQGWSGDLMTQRVWIDPEK
ncbi:MAG: SusD/RagB family nutrient-binding outer membrane lipoprotein, partial [Tannerella sp.]|nr:SusD/RagB family nutrient-binding outer membrane lipoprotein [Tannerella sp.]